MFLIKEMPFDERPRERLIKKGVSSLSNAELLAILLRSGSRDKSVISLSKDVLYQLNLIQDLKKLTITELMNVKGIKEAKATTIIAAIELGRRLNDVVRSETEDIRSAHDIYYSMIDLKDREQENFYCILLNSKMQIITKELIYIGTVNQISIHPREVFKSAIKNNAVTIILVHNHPSGDPSPSKADIEATKILNKAAEVINIDILDHVIIGNNRFYSFTEQKIFSV
ncbi:RadC family protein [Haploplasma axanthum]|uniref:DNA repair protein RadC n=1 Tax=Haploplasma axanthum TaxID=29552 RepID=A0A449BE90_HAPAX|nr:DNA repair protein RadC [Haploplasma axanthum]VEU80747.1 DNA repair protein RadC [Haploplasma axanthum]